MRAVLPEDNFDDGQPGEKPAYASVVEDVKGFKTPLYRLKRKLMLLVHQIRITET